MSVGNVIDYRGKSYAAARINVVIEPSWHDNDIEGADQHPRSGSVPSAAERYGVSLAEALAWADTFDAPMTLFLYDADVDPMGAREPVPAERLEDLRALDGALSRAEEAVCDLGEDLGDGWLAVIVRRARRRAARILRAAEHSAGAAGR